MRTLAKFWLIETGCDCDGSWTRGRVGAYANLSDAEKECESACEWSDGLGYQIIDDRALLGEYCDDHGIDANRYIYV